MVTSILALTGLIVCTSAAVYSRIQWQRLRRELEREPVIYIHFEVDDEQAYPVDVLSRRAQAMRANAPWN